MNDFEIELEISEDWNAPAIRKVLEEGFLMIFVCRIKGRGYLTYK